MDILSRIETEGARVERRLQEHLDARRPKAPRLDEAIRYSLLGGGKRLRPILCLWTHDALGSPRGPEVWAAALALEMLHTYSLIHDDLPAMDDDDLRRGQPSCHVRFDEATAILAGDALQTEAFAVLGQLEDAQTGHWLVRVLAEAAGGRGMAAGQQLDLDAAAGEARTEQMMTIHGLKTGRVLGAAVAMGAITGGGSPETVERAHQAGEELGMAFQIIDDVLDETASAASLGKTAGKDREQGKVTAVAALGASAARELAETRLESGVAHLRRLGLASDALVALAGFLVRRSR